MIRPFRFENWIAFRFLFSKDRSFAVTLLTFIGVIGVAVSVCAMILIRSVMSGFSFDLQQKILRLNPTVVLSSSSPFPENFEKNLSENSSVSDFFRYMDGEAILHTEENVYQGVQLKGFDLRQALPFLEKLKIEWVDGSSDFNQLLSADERLPGIIVGSELIKRLSLIAVTSPEVDLIYPFGEVDPSGEIRPKKRRFRVVGTFKSGYFDYDNKLILLNLQEMKRLIPESESSMKWGVQLKHIFETEQFSSSLSKKISSEVQIKTWKQQNQKLFEALRTEKIVMMALLLLMTTLSSFNILSLTSTMVSAKREQIALLQAIGMTKKELIRLFLKIGGMIGLIGSILGSSLAVTVIFFLKKYPVSVPSSYYLDFLPVRWELSFTLFIAVTAPFLTIAAAWFPARKVIRFHPVKILRGE